MTRLYAVLLVSALSCLQGLPVWGSSSEKKPEPSSTQANREAMPPTAPAEEAAAPAAQPPAFTAQDALKKQRYLAEEMTMQRAWMYSTVIPGWGQLYNGHYWKVPTMYALLAGLGWGAAHYHRAYTTAQFEDYGRNRDLFLIFMGLVYVSNIFDAYVGASLKTFDLSEDISLEVQPSGRAEANNLPRVGLSLSLNLKP